VETVGFVGALMDIGDGQQPGLWYRLTGRSGRPRSPAGGSADDAAPRGFEASADSGAAVPEQDGAELTLCAACHTVLRLTDEQAVIAEAEVLVLDVITMAFCRRCARG
jgi:hypothetical protein